MSKKISGLIRKFRFKSILVSQMLLIFACCIILCAAFSVYFVEVSVHSAQKHQEELNQAYVDTLMGNMEYLVGELEQSLTQLSYSRNIASMIYTDTYSENVINQVLSDMALTSNNNMLIETALLYIPGSQYVIGDNYKGYALDDSPYSQMIHSYDLGQVQATIIESNTKHSKVFFFDQAGVVIARDFPLSGKNRLATLYYIVNMKEVYRRLSNKIVEGGLLFGYDGFGNSLFADEVVIMDQSARQNMIFESTSDRLKWTFFYQMDSNHIGTSVYKMFWKICPAMLIILGCVSVVSFFSAVRLYRPMNQLLMNLESQKTASDIIPALKNELDYLEWTFSELFSHQKELDTMVHDVSNDILTRFFMDCLNGTQITYANVKKILNSANSRFKTNAYYTVCVVKIEEDVGALPDCQENIRKILESLEKKTDMVFHILKMDEMHVTILSFNEEQQPLSIQKTLSELKKMFADVTYFQKRHTQIGIGKLYRSILDLGFSWRDAQENLKKSKELSDETEGRDDLLALKEENLFEKKAHQIFQHVENGDTDDARILAERTVDEIAEMDMEQNQKKSYKVFIEILLSDVLNMEYADFSKFSSQLQEDPIKKMMKSPVRDWSDYTKSWCMELIEELDKMFKKQQNRYIVAAQEYINIHCLDPNLSLNTIAEAIHVNPSYLSKLFKANLGIYFTDYLNKARINYSIVFLTDTEKTIKEIAAACGYGTVQNYIRVFKKYMGQAPGQYRDSIKQSEEK